MPSRIKITKSVIRELRPPDRGRLMVYDTIVPSLAVRVTPTGHVGFYVYRRVRGQPTFVHLGNHPDLTPEQAREAASRVIADIGSGRTPRPRIRGQKTLLDLFEHWMIHAKAHKASWKEDERQFEKYLTHWRTRQLATITKAEVVKLHAEIGAENGRITANRVLALVRAMFNRADDLGFEGRNPCSRVKPFREESRDRFLLPEEMTKFFAALEDEPEYVRHYFTLCVLTGQRGCDVRSMAWKEIDFGQAVWRNRQRKTREIVSVPLVEEAIDILKARSGNDSQWVFPAKRREGYLGYPQKSWERIQERSGLTDLKPHDLRRTVGSWQAINGSSLHVIGAALGHKTAEATAIYSRLTDAAVRDSVSKATSAILAAAKGESNAKEG
jgi:integrase